MVSIRRLFQDYRETGAVASLLALWGFVDDGVFLTKAGAVGLVYRLQGVDDECLDHEARRAIVARVEQAFRRLDERCRVYQYLLKHPAAVPAPAPHPHPAVDAALRERSDALAARSGRLFELEAYLVVLFEGWPAERLAARRVGLLQLPRRVRRAFSATETIAALHRELFDAAARLRQAAEAFIGPLTDALGVTRLNRDEAYRFLRRLVNYAPHKRQPAGITHDTHLDFYAADSEIECHRDHLEVDGYQVKVLTMQEPPVRTHAHLFQALGALPGAFVACLEWQRWSEVRARREIHARRRHFFNKRVSLVNYLSAQTKPDEMLVDTSATATVHELGEALTALEVHGHAFGACSLTVVLYDRDARELEQRVADTLKAFAGHDGALYEERFNLLNAWLAVVPGNVSHNLRRLLLLDRNAADLSPVFVPDVGHRTSAHLGGRECLAVFDTEQATPYFWTLHHDDIGHVLIQGATGSGKSFLTAFLASHAQKYDPFTVILDLGGTYDGLVRRLGGSAWRLRLTEPTFRINPFCLPPTPQNLHFLAAFVRVLLQSANQYTVTVDDDRELLEAIENLYVLDAPQRRLFTLASLLPRRLSPPLHRWIQGGPYAALFDNVEDTLTLQRVQSFDFEGLERYPLVLEPLLFYVLHRTSTFVQNRAAGATLKLFILDEAWRFVRDPTIKAYVTEALKTWRKRNAALVLATQSTEDFVDGDLLRTVVESCPTQFFLANPGANLDQVRTLFRLSHTEAAWLTRLRPRQQALLKRPDVAKVINLRVDPASTWLYASTPSVSVLPMREGQGAVQEGSDR